jgi:hypothetical protein
MADVVATTITSSIPASRHFRTLPVASDFPVSTSKATRFGGGTGVQSETAATSRWCPELEEAIEETACSSCDKVEQCYHDSKQEEQDREEGEVET